MYTGILPKTQQPFYIRPLRDNLYDGVASKKLQTAIISLLGHDQTLLHERTPNELRQRCDGQTAVTLGVFVKGQNGRDKLIAQQTLELIPDETVPLPTQLCLNRNEFGCVSGFMVHPNYRGNGLTDLLLDCLQQWGRQSFQKKGFISMVDANNPFSYNVLLNRGFAIVDTYIDPSDNGKTYAFLNHPVLRKMRQVEVEKWPADMYNVASCILKHKTAPALITKREKITPLLRLTRMRERVAA